MRNKDDDNPGNLANRVTAPELRSMLDGLVDDLFKQLRELEEMSRPGGAEITAEQKDKNAFTALASAGLLVDILAGWAINHMVGLGLHGLESVPRQLRGEKVHPKYLAAQAAADDHRHEKTGGAQTRKSFEKLDPIVLRHILINLLRPNPGGFPPQIQEMIVEALEALNYSETLPIVTAVESGRKAKLRELRLQLQAVAFVEYRRAQGTLKGKAQEEVADAYGVSTTTVRLWEHRLRQELGQLEVSRKIQFAKNAVAQERETRRKIAAARRFRLQFAIPALKASANHYGRQALKQAAARYQRLIKQRKA